MITLKIINIYEGLVSIGNGSERLRFSGEAEKSPKQFERRN